MKLYGIAVLTVITSTIGYIVAAVSLPILPAVLGMPRDISALFIGSLSSGALGALITFFPLQFTELFKRWWIVALIGGLLAAFTSIFALDFPNINGPAFAPTAGDVISEPLLLFVVWQAGMSIYLIFCSLMSKRY